MTRKEFDGGVRQWRDTGLNLKANVTCGTCNNGWMSDLESKSIPIISDMILKCSNTTLQSREIAIIAAIAFKNVIVADYMHDRRPPFFTFAERQSFANTLAIPDGVQMWLASVPVKHGLFKSYYGKSPSRTPDGFELNVFTYGVGHLVIQVVTSRWRKKFLRRHANPPFVTQDRAWDEVSVPFWPSDGTPIQWPAPAHLGNEIIDTFVHRWNRLVPGWKSRPVPGWG
jgi:hypothetical protein